MHRTGDGGGALRDDVWMSRGIRLSLEEQDLCVGEVGAAWFGNWRVGRGYAVIERDGRTERRGSQKAWNEPPARAPASGAVDTG